MAAPAKGNFILRMRNAVKQEAGTKLAWRMSAIDMKG
jgi:hypothetical protein